ncbi:MAG: low molecular weight protein-tyrosine-phosphatase [Alphaproteobacteria bacterium]
MMKRILFVCLGNICRSPTAEAVARARFQAAGLNDVEVASAGTGGWHIGKSPDERAMRAAANRGYDMRKLRGAQVRRQDFNDFDLILAMDKDNLADLQARQPASGQAASGKGARLALLMDYAPGRAGEEVPDPYYGNGDGFATVLDMIEEAVDGLISTLRNHS